MAAFSPNSLGLFIFPLDSRKLATSANFFAKCLDAVQKQKKFIEINLLFQNAEKIKTKNIGVLISIQKRPNNNQTIQLLFEEHVQKVMASYKSRPLLVV